MLVAALLAAACASSSPRAGSFADLRADDRGQVRLVGWMRLQGEIELYADRSSMRLGDVFPTCVSAVFADQQARQVELSRFEGERVILSGRAYIFSDLPDEDRPFIPRKMLAGAVVSNFCHGPVVVLAEAIEAH